MSKNFPPFSNFFFKTICTFTIVITSFSSNAQTNNYFGASGTLSGSVWSTNPAGPYTSALNSTGGAIINFGNTASFVGASITVAGINATANATETSAAGTISNAVNIVPITVGIGVTLDFSTQSFTSAAGAGYIKNGAGILAMAGNTYGGGFTLNAGTMIVRGVNAMGSAGVNTLAINGGILASNANRDLSGKYAGGITIGGDFQIGDISGLASSSANLTFTNNMALGGTLKTITLGNSGNQGFGGIISGTAGITYTANSNGGGRFDITNTANTLSGTTNINGNGTGVAEVRFSTDGSIGTVPATVTANSIIVDGGRLASLSGSAVTIDSKRGIQVGNSAGTSISAVGNGGSLIYNGIIADKTGVTGSWAKQGAGTLSLGGVSTYTGSTGINNGIVQLTTGTNRLPIGTTINLGQASNTNLGTLDLNGFSQEVAGLNSVTGTNAVTTVDNIVTSTAAATLTLSGSGAYSYGNFTDANSGIITGAISIVKNGTGTQVLGDANTYTGTTTINGGALQLSKTGGTTIPITGSVTVNNTGTLRISSNQTLANLTLAAGATLTVDAGITLSITGTLNVNTGATISSTGTIDYSSSTGQLVYSGSVTRTAGIEWITTGVPNTVSIGSAATILLAANKTTTNTLTVNGTLNAATYSITGTGTVNINGTFITANLNGFTGTGAAFTGASPVLGAASTVEYNAPSGSQIVTTSPSYVNLTLSVGGTKTAASLLNISNNLTISGAAIFNSGNAAIGGTGTNLIMTGTARFLTGGTVTKPDAQGTYSLATGTTIEFTNNSAGTQEDIRLAGLQYANIDISGTNVGNNSAVTGISFKSGSTFTVKSGGVFNIENTAGFSGGTATAISSTNSPAIVLETNSTVGYTGSGNQAITNQLSYQNLKIAGSNTKTAPALTLSIAGNFTKTTAASVFAHNNGIVSFDGTSTVAFTATNIVEFYKLTNNTSTAAGSLTINSDLGVNNLFTVTAASKTIFGSGNINIRSAASFTAAIDMVPAGASFDYSGSGRFMIEKYILTPRKWQFLSSNAVSETQSFQSSWMDGQALGSPVSTGYGMWITGAGGQPNFDAATTTPTIKFWNGTDFTGINGVSDDIHLHDSYMTYVRGDRASTGTSPVGVNLPTILRAKGQIHTGNFSFATVPAYNSAMSFGNPYASAVDLRLLSTGASTSTVLTFYVWDPKLTTGNGLGAYQTITGTQAGGFSISPGAGSYGAQNSAMNTIESGQAFFMQGAAQAVTLQFTETAKSAYQSTVSFAPGHEQYLGAVLSLKNSGGADVVDGVMLKFADSYNNAADFSDAGKLINTSENISIKKDGKLLAAEYRKPAEDYDTVYLNMANLRLGNYQWNFRLNNMDQPGRAAFLVDKFTGTETLLNLSGSVSADFAVSSAAGSYAAGRFIIVFRPAAVVPVLFTSVSAARNPDKTVTVKWNTENEIAMQNYEVEYSNDGNHFDAVATVLPSNNTGGNAAYNFTDGHAVNGVNYYRIRGTGTNNAVHFTSFVKVDPIKTGSGISIYPNPATGKTINLYFANKKAGDYLVSVINNSGQIIKTQTIQLRNNGAYMIKLSETTPAGIYKLSVKDPSAGQATISLMMK